MTATPTPLMPVKECGTPDAVYGALVTAKHVKFTVSFPVPLIAPQGEKAFIAEMHAAMLPVIERLYERRWAQMFANGADKEGRPYPATYAELWPAPPTSNHAASAAAIPENPENVQGEA